MYEFTTPLWLWDGGGDASWHFVTVPDDETDEIRARTEGLRGGFGSVKVEVTVGATTWRTSVFPDSKRDAFVLPVKKAVRKAESLTAGADVEVRLSLVGM